MNWRKRKKLIRKADRALGIRHGRNRENSAQYLARHTGYTPEQCQRWIDHQNALEDAEQ